ncbi:TetR/AcrR family transcriptional regulator [uncultured Tenacibaculum sp.]|uniref:TetR/AcrR family transcriptional regulator n=1 Tax=uncultured Tenacibaculum sp. TaxID=174713 RepID=UPI002625D0A0|nr:TetR/AcrR family transcriptional regulator [uncultured Tenacibaculum sp.]
MNNTKAKILLAAIKAFSKSPNASMEEIAESINLSRRTLHRYFSGKSELITEIINYASTLCLEKTKEAVKSSINPINQLNTMFLSDIESGYQFRFLYSYRDGLQGMEKESSDFREMMQIFRHLLKTLKNIDLINSKITIDWIESLYFSTIDSAINLILEDDSRMQEIAEMAWLSYFNAITNHTNNQSKQI